MSTGYLGGRPIDPMAAGCAADSDLNDDPRSLEELEHAHPRTPWGHRNGMPASARYRYRPGEAKQRALAARDRDAQWWHEHLHGMTTE